MYHARRNAGRYQLRPIPTRGWFCAAGSGCIEKATHVASSPSFSSKPMCQKHAAAWAKRHRIEVQV